MDSLTLAKLNISQGDLRAFCQHWGVSKLALFGSILRDDFNAESDIDMLVAFQSQRVYSLWDLIEMEATLSDMLGRQVDLGEYKAVEQDPNYLRRQHILSTMQFVYVER